MVIFMTKDIINVIQIDEEVDAEYEAAKVLRKYPKETVMLNNIKGYDIPVVSGICNTREKIAQSLGCQVDEILYKIIDGMNNPTPVSKFIDLIHLFPKGKGYGKGFGYFNSYWNGTCHSSCMYHINTNRCR